MFPCILIVKYFKIILWGFKSSKFLSGNTLLLHFIDAAKNNNYITLELGKFENNQLILSSIQNPQGDNHREWKIKVPGNKIVVLEFIFFQTGNGKVALHDGTNNKKFTLIKELSGNNINQKILYGTTGNKMLIEYDSDNAENGFVANITGKEV